MEKRTVPAVTAVATRGRNAMQILAAKYNVDQDKMAEVLRATVFPKATNEELVALCIVADQYNLNPWLRELYAFPSQGKGIVPIVPIDGWTKIINRHKDDEGKCDYDGCEFEEKDGDNGKPFSTTCTMHVKGREHPVKVTEYYTECYRNTNPWNQMPRRMLRHKSFMQTGRYAFGLSGLFDEDEARDITAGVTVGEARAPIAEPKALGEGAAAAAEPTVTTAAQPAAPTTVSEPNPARVIFTEVLKKDSEKLVETKTGAKVPEWTRYTGISVEGTNYISFKRAIADEMKRSKDEKLPFSVGWKPGKKAGEREVTMMTEMDPAQDDDAAERAAIQEESKG